jgi:hypothetical protein
MVMADLPAGLASPPPRDPAAGFALLQRNRRSIYGCIVAAGAVVPLVLLIFWLGFGEIGGAAIGTAMGLCALLALLAAAIMVNMGRALAFYRDGILIEGRVASAPHNQGVPIYLVDFADSLTGQIRQAQLAAVGSRGEGIGPGTTLPVLLLESKRKFVAIYAPNAGLWVAPVRKG